jgi:hypothetical protein
MYSRTKSACKRIFVRSNRILISVLVVFSTITPVLIITSSSASADQFSERQLVISTAQAAKTANYSFYFLPTSTSSIQSLIFQSCVNALGACNTSALIPSGINIGGGGTVTEPTFPSSTTNDFTKDTTSASASANGVNCTVSSNLCLTRSDTTAQSTTSEDQVLITGAINQDATNCSGAPNCTFFIRIYAYANNNYTSNATDPTQPTAYGTVASSTTQAFTVNATIQEELSFCVGSVSNATNSENPAVPTSCATVTGTSLNLGTLNFAGVSVSPVPVALGGDGNEAMLMLNTNSADGTIVNYDAVQSATGTNHLGTLRVSGATCVGPGNANTDQCINAVGTTATTLTAGTEHFGMTVADDACNAVTAYTCNFNSGQFNLVPTAAYNCDGIAGSGNNNTALFPTNDQGLVSGTTTCKYAWDETGADNTIAASTNAGSSVGAVGDEALIIKFAATPNLITPTGVYSVQADYVAAPNY